MSKSATRPPTDWEKAGPIKVRQFLRDPAGGPWLRSEIARLPTGLVAAATPEDREAMIALLLAQNKLLHQRAGKYDDMPESLKEEASWAWLHGVRELFFRALATGKPLPKPARDRKEHDRESEPGKRRAGSHPWLDPEQQGPDLRRALCYQKKQFGRLVKKYRLRPTRRGREDVFTCQQALQLLAHRLKSRPPLSREIASRIWASTAFLIRRARQLTAEFAELRRILETTGCECTLAADGLPDATDLDRILDTAKLRRPGER